MDTNQVPNQIPAGEDENGTSSFEEKKKINSKDQSLHGLPMLDGDPWEIIFNQNIEADTLRCNAWKDEVQNLLIFAGLFSAVVTPFVIESYKFLQPVPSDAIAGLLFHIANGLNNTSAFPPSVNPESINKPFSQTGSSIRINVCWFISLILSLTTVLIGTISLQWLREHQSYAGCSGKEKVAMLHMRSAALEAWYLPQVFAVLPLLLQLALFLFFAGLIDFSLLLGPKLTIPVIIAIVLTALVVVATIVLPAFQGLSFFYQPHPRETLPIPCPFKSPQSHAFRALVRAVLRLIFKIFPPLSLSDIQAWPSKRRWIFTPDYLVPSVYKLWNQRSWCTYDREWLSLRDAFHQRILDTDGDLYQHRSCWEDSFPLSDVTQSLVKAVGETSETKCTEPFLTALVHCFCELSESIWAIDQDYHLFLLQRRDRRNQYFEQLHFKPSCSMSKFLLHGGVYKFDRFSQQSSYTSVATKMMSWQRLFCDDQIMIFIVRLLQKHKSPVLARYQLDLWLRVLRDSIHESPFTTLEPTNSINTTPAPPNNPPTTTFIPTVINLQQIVYFNFPNFPFDERYSAAASILSTILTSAADRTSNNMPMNTLCVHPHIVKVIYDSAIRVADYLELNQKNPPANGQVLSDVGDQFIKIFTYISNQLSMERSCDVCFYLSSIFVWALLREIPAQEIVKNKDSYFGRALRSLIHNLHKIWTSGQKDDEVENSFSLLYPGTFSADWWNSLFKRGNISQAATSTDVTLSESRRGGPSHLVITLGDTTDNATGP